MQMALKRPHAISFSKKNVVRPFEDATSLEFWARKNDASMFVLGQSTKKRPNGLTIARMFDGRLLDMCELGVDQFVSMDEFKVRSHWNVIFFNLLKTCTDTQTTTRAQAHVTLRFRVI
jgi:Brix domain